ncbi:MAG: hypothetical protein MUP70_03370, partial [Candidatus Aminicenantes bacterium]|nr:hypothetical protein [Candidatus Aminicenantes bacterium]
ALLEKGDDLFKTWLDEPDLELADELQKYIPPALDMEVVEDRIGGLLKSEEGLFPDLQVKHRYLMGKLMPGCRGHVTAEEVGQLLWRRLEGKDNSHE